MDEAAFRAALGGGRADLGTVARYLTLSVPDRPALSPVFDPVFYRVRNPELPADADPLLDFLGRGLARWRDPHPLVELQHIARQGGNLLGTPPTSEALAHVLDYDLADPSPYFDLEFYAAQLATPEKGLLRHYLTFGLIAGLSPNRWLDPAWYARTHDDVPHDPRAALRHFVLLGDPMARAAGPLFDGNLYRRRYPDVAAAGTPPLWHFLAFGRREGRQAASDRPLPRLPPATMAAEMGASATGDAVPIDPARVVHTHARMERRIAARLQAAKDAVRGTPPPLIVCSEPEEAIARIRLPSCRRPRLSILVAAYNQAAHTVACLVAVSERPPSCPFEVVLADDGSTDPIFAQLAEVRNLVVVRSATNRGFIRACNDAFGRCRGDYVLLLNNDAQPLAGAVDALVAALDVDPGLGAAGPKLLYPNGRLQEAGCFIRPDGETGMAGLFQDPADRAYGFDRDVAYCSGAALLVRRAAVGETLFDEAYRPAYCEDVDLCLRLRERGLRTRYIAASVMVHHLSGSADRRQEAERQRRIARNTARLQERWGDLLAELDRVRPIAFYLPQFHPTPENELWWGAGFTEWTNVARAQPSYAGHYQPHLPADLGFYDLRVPDVLRRQAALARRYGLEGFCVYHYDFGSKRMLDTPMRAVLADPTIDFRHCLCWANENWTRNWDGGAREVLIEQRYDEATLARVVADVVATALDPRSIRVRGCPLFLLYRPLQLPDAAAFAARLRSAMSAAGFPGAHLAYVESMEASDEGLRPAEIGFDAAVEFPPHGRAVPAEDAAAVLKERWSGYRYDYERYCPGLSRSRERAVAPLPHRVSELGQHTAAKPARHQF